MSAQSVIEIKLLTSGQQLHEARKRLLFPVRDLRTAVNLFQREVGFPQSLVVAALS